MHYIDQKEWKRSKHFDFFKKFKNPYFNICTDIEITNTYSYTRKNKISIFTAVLFAVMKTCNYFEEFRYRIENDRIKVHKLIHPGITILSDNDVYYTCTFDYKERFKEFLEEYNNAIDRAKKEFLLDEKQKERDDLVFISSLPWMTFTSVTNPMDGNPLDSIPRFIVGKLYKREGKILMPISVQVNHCLMDGVHVAKFFFKLTDSLKEPEKLF
jgi:chloramphenicol O-acetyltransferase type A